MKIGIDLGGTTVSMGVVDDNYKIVAEAEFPTADCKTPKELTDIVINGPKKLMEENKISKEQISFIGMG
ncbi:MAG: ROK family protein, partial [Clostridia bacterium]|nr:ROK family protein [Clostridia bacterium]